METAKLQGAQYARSLIEASLDPLITINMEGKITDMNEALADITGKSREQLTGTDFFRSTGQRLAEPSLNLIWVRSTGIALDGTARTESGDSFKLSMRSMFMSATSLVPTKI